MPDIKNLPDLFDEWNAFCSVYSVFFFAQLSDLSMLIWMVLGMMFLSVYFDDFKCFKPRTLVINMWFTSIQI